MSGPQIPLLVIVDPRTYRSIWAGRLDQTPAHLYEILQLSLYDDEEPETYLAELFMGSDKDLEDALASGAHPARFLQERCEELYLGDYIEVKLSGQAA